MNVMLRSCAAFHAEQFSLILTASPGGEEYRPDQVYNVTETVVY